MTTQIPYLEIAYDKIIARKGAILVKFVWC